MKKRILIGIAVVAAAVLLVVPFAYAQHAGRHGFGRGDMGVMMLGHLQRAKEVLGLSDQQVSDIQAIFQDLKTQNQPLRQSMHGNLGTVAQTLLNNPNDLAAAQAQLAQQEATEHQMKLNALNAASKAINVLTPDQRAKLQTLIQERIARHANH